jgi:hypothetical protein
MFNFALQFHFYENRLNLVQSLLIGTQDYTMDSLGCQNTKSNQVMFQTKKQEESEY